MHTRFRHAAALACLLAPAALAAQTSYRTMAPGEVFSGACTGSSSGGGQQRAGVDPFAQHFGPGSPKFLCDMETATAGPISTSSAVPDQGAQFLRAESTADFGVLKVYAEQHVRRWELDDFWFPVSRAGAGWVDQLLVENPLYTGQTGTLTGLLHVTGTIYGRNDKGVAGFDLRSFQGTSTFGTVELNVERRNQAAAVTVDELVPVTFTFTFGTARKVGVFALAQAGVRAETTGGNFAPGDVFADFANTVTWTGIESITVGGAAVAGSAISSASGSDWYLGAQATVPEPATSALVAAGLAVVGVAARRRRGAATARAT